MKAILDDDARATHTRKRTRRGCAPRSCRRALPVGCGFSAAELQSAVSRAGVSAAFQPVSSSFLLPSTGFVLGAVGCHFGFDGAQRRCQPVILATATQVSAGAACRHRRRRSSQSR